jgi:SLT domain-containing protein
VRHNATHAEFARTTIDEAIAVKRVRQFVGYAEGFSVRRERIWTIGNIGTFKVIVEEEGADA